MTVDLTVTIRAARVADLLTLQAIQVAAGAAFRDVGMAEIADNPPLSLDVLTAYQHAGRAWVAADGGGSLVGFVVADVIGGCAHVEQVSVAPSNAGRGVGRRLLDRVTEWAWDRGMPAVTLTTFRQVPWNAPYYARCGFRELTDAELGAGLSAVLVEEAAFGLDPADRVAMRRPVPSARPEVDTG